MVWFNSASISGVSLRVAQPLLNKLNGMEGHVNSPEKWSSYNSRKPRINWPQSIACYFFDNWTVYIQLEPIFGDGQQSGTGTVDPRRERRFSVRAIFSFASSAFSLTPRTMSSGAFSTNCKIKPDRKSYNMFWCD